MEKFRIGRHKYVSELLKRVPTRNVPMRDLKERSRRLKRDLKNNDYDIRYLDGNMLTRAIEDTENDLRVIEM